jgi:hypothetical protein
MNETSACDSNPCRGVLKYNSKQYIQNIFIIIVKKSHI